MPTTFTPSPTFSGLALAGLFTGLTDGVQADASYILTGASQPGKVTPQATPSMVVTLSGFTCVLAGTSPGVNGPQLWTTGAGSYNITLDPPDTTNSRIDLITVQITAQPNPAATPPTPGQANLVVATGTPAASPVAPTVPAGSLVVAQITVPAGASSVIGSGQIAQRGLIGALRGGLIRAWQGFYQLQVAVGQQVYYEGTDRLQVRKGDGTLENIPGIGATPEWYLTGVPAGFTVPNNVGTAAMGFANTVKSVGVGIASIATGAVVTTTEAGSYQVRASATIAAGSAGNNRRMLLERRNSAGVKQERIQMEPFWNANIGPRFNCVGRIRMNAGDTIFAALFQDSGAALAPINTDLDWVFEGYKVMDL